MLKNRIKTTEIHKTLMNEFNYKTDYILEDETLLLRPLKLDDFNHLLNFSIND